jgi:hypothetical protein
MKIQDGADKNCKVSMYTVKYYLSIDSAIEKAARVRDQSALLREQAFGPGRTTAM